MIPTLTARFVQNPGLNTSSFADSATHCTATVAIRINADTTQGTQEVTDATEGTQENQENHDGNHSGESTDMVEGHLDPAQLEEMNKDDLKKLAKDMGVDLPRGAAKALIVERLAAAIVQTPAAAIVPPAADNGGGAQ